MMRLNRSSKPRLSLIPTSAMLTCNSGFSVLTAGIFQERLPPFKKRLRLRHSLTKLTIAFADVYRRTGDAEKASRETELFKQSSENKKMHAEREHHEMQQFVYTLRGQSAPPKTPLPDPH